jgi:hypothetical protein
LRGCWGGKGRGGREDVGNVINRGVGRWIQWRAYRIADWLRKLNAFWKSVWMRKRREWWWETERNLSWMKKR